MELGITMRTTGDIQLVGELFLRHNAHLPRPTKSRMTISTVLLSQGVHVPNRKMRFQDRLMRMAHHPKLFLIRHLLNPKSNLSPSLRRLSLERSQTPPIALQHRFNQITNYLTT